MRWIENRREEIFAMCIADKKSLSRMPHIENYKAMWKIQTALQKMGKDLKKGRKHKRLANMWKNI